MTYLLNTPMFYLYVVTTLGLLFYDYFIWGPKNNVNVGTWIQMGLNSLFLIATFLIRPYTGTPVDRFFTSWEVHSFFLLPRSIFIFVFIFLIFDFGYYWFHRFAHNNDFLWAIHSTHHVDTELNVTTSWRGNFAYYVFLKSLLSPFIFVGMTYDDLLVCITYFANYQPWLHSRVIGKIPYLEGIITTPAAHRLHHASNEQYLGTNYGGCFMIWDRMFGTYVVETEKALYAFPKEKTGNIITGQYREPLNYFKSLYSRRLKDTSR